MTFIYDYSTYVKVHLLKNKGNAFSRFHSCKTEVKNQLGKKNKKICYILFNDFCEKIRIVLHHIQLSPMVFREKK